MGANETVASPSENRAASVFISDATTRLQMPNLPPFSCLYTAVSTANVHANNVVLITGTSSRVGYIGTCVHLTKRHRAATVIVAMHGIMTNKACHL